MAREIILLLEDNSCLGRGKRGYWNSCKVLQSSKSFKKLSVLVIRPTESLGPGHPWYFFPPVLNCFVSSGQTYLQLCKKVNEEVDLLYGSLF